MANDKQFILSNFRDHQFFLKDKKKKNTKIKTRKTKSRTTINTTEETIKRTTATF